MKTWKKIVIISSILILSSVSLYLLQNKIDYFKEQEKDIEGLLYLPTGKFLKVIALGYDELIADVIWVKAVGYFGGHLLTDRQYTWLYHMLDLVTTLDPQYQYPYHFGGIILSIEVEQVENSNKLLKKGMEHFPEVWQFPFYIGFNYFYHLGELSTAARYLAIASQLPGHPKYLPQLTARLYDQSGEKENAVQFLQVMYSNIEDENMKKQIKERIEKIEEGEEY